MRDGLRPLDLVVRSRLNGSGPVVMHIAILETSRLRVLGQDIGLEVMTHVVHLGDQDSQST